MFRKTHLLDIVCTAQQLKDVMHWCQGYSQRCETQIIKYDCQENTVLVTVRFDNKEAFVEFQLTFT